MCMYKAILFYNRSIHSTTKMTPYDAQYTTFDKTVLQERVFRNKERIQRPRNSNFHNKENIPKSKRPMTRAERTRKLLVSQKPQVKQ